MNRRLIALPVATPDGVFLAHYSELGLARLNFPKPARGKPTAGAPPEQVLRWHRVTTPALKNVLAARPARNLPPLDWTGATECQQSVWRAMVKLAPGQTRSYGEIAADIGRPKAVRAVGGACGANPIPVLVPCHRILAANKKIGGFSGGLPWKYRLLEREGVEFQGASPKDSRK